ncbi:hypothetical protein OIU74_002200 [Salix koriyanagi]|uniref:Uncharacterized protein n=1 Tax=Salix koriyanagi TaxID=2511006 RepID=A0A9Q0X3R3_9ROSI|nr:hypothetical protein OIU74_002200 [Salix koriyanagi]
MARRPAMRITHIKKNTCFRSGLLDECFNDAVDDLGNEKTKSEKHAVELSTE